jgi:hypothetical protein
VGAILGLLPTLYFLLGEPDAFFARTYRYFTELHAAYFAELDLRGFLGLDEAVAPGYHVIDYTVRVDGDGSDALYQEVHEAVVRTSPNYFNMARPIRMNGRLEPM